MIAWLFLACAQHQPLAQPPDVAAPAPAGLSAPARSAYVQGQAALAMGDLAEAERQFRRAMVFDGASPEPKLGLAEALLQAGRPEEARPLIEGVLAAEPARADALKLAEKLPKIAE